MSGAHPAGGRLPSRLADRFFLAAHTGDDRLAPGILDERLAMGCAAALLGELVLDDEIALAPVVRPSGPGRCPDFLAWTILREVRHGAERDLRGWFELLGNDAGHKVRARLVLVDALREVRPSGGRRGGPLTAWRTVNNQVGSTAEVLERLFTDDDNAARNGMISPSQRLADIVLALLVRETGVLRQIELSKRAAGQGEARMEAWRSRFPPALRALVDELSDLCARSSIRAPW
ncbi:GPP34 family phosphoprotein [Saccharopolyspora griseoalba]|uniref:GPP34 family phosphoprotein n=1 Tax=Saccharopolyspora griseoalba TaxID=1431848 RepID=A0ABW2LD99_9PSEU